MGLLPSTKLGTAEQRGLHRIHVLPTLFLLVRWKTIEFFFFKKASHLVLAEMANLSFKTFHGGFGSERTTHRNMDKYVGCYEATLEWEETWERNRWDAHPHWKVGLISGGTWDSVSPQPPCSYSDPPPAALCSSCSEDFSTSACDHYEISACQRASLNLLLHPVICSK